MGRDFLLEHGKVTVYLTRTESDQLTAYAQAHQITREGLIKRIFKTWLKEQAIQAVKQIEREGSR